MARATELLNPNIRGPEAERFESELRSRIVGQDEAIQEVASVFQMFVAGVASPGRPVGNFLFLGPTGTGKTRMVEAIAEALTGNPRAVVKVDCAEFQHSHEIAKLIGSPPGYLGHRETHPALSQDALDKHHTEKLKLSIVLFDEIEKASDALWNLLLGILDKGTLTLGDNRQVDFSRSLVFLTSNLGAREMMSLVRPALGFAGVEPDRDALSGKVEKAAVEAARRKFTPEFLNRIDKVLVFQPLGQAELHRILDLELEQLRKRFRDRAAAAFDFSLSASAREFLLEQGTDARYGARHLKRAIERGIVAPISNLLASAQVRHGDVIRIDLDPALRRLLFYRDPNAEPAAEAVAPARETPRPAEPERSLAAVASRQRPSGVRRISGK
jgi:ATP-dependent Clp protease ATP-binding subunit ClpA